MTTARTTKGATPKQLTYEEVSKAEAARIEARLKSIDAKRRKDNDEEARLLERYKQIPKEFRSGSTVQLRTKRQTRGATTIAKPVKTVLSFVQLGGDTVSTIAHVTAGLLLGVIIGWLFAFKLGGVPIFGMPFLLKFALFLFLTIAGGVIGYKIAINGKTTT